MSISHHHKRALGTVDMTLFTVSAILLLDTLAASASIGVSSIFWWLFLGLIFFIPYGLMNAEMGTAYPEQGGIYAWVRDTLGRRWGTRITWMYWFNTMIWNASVLILFASIFSAMFWPQLSLQGQLVMALILTWLTTLTTCLSLKMGKWVPNVGAAVKMLTFAAIILGGIAYLTNGEVTLANDFSFEAFIPRWNEGTQYLTTIIYGMLGFELMCAASEEMKHPQRDIPRAILFSGISILAMYTLGTLAILLVIPVENINLVEGLVDTLKILFGDSALGSLAATTFGIFALFTFFSNATTWSIGANRAAAEAALDGELPGWFGKEHAKYGTPVGAALMMGASTSLMLLGYGAIAGTNEDLFWSLFAASAVLFLIPYVAAAVAFYRSRQIDAQRPRPFRVPGGNGTALALSVVCATILLLTIALFMYIPGSGFDWPVIFGSVGAIVLGEIIIRATEKSGHASPFAKAAAD